MSKKLAEGLNALVLDVKWGSGAFMRKQEDARTLAQAMVDTGERMNVRTTALLTDMNQPHGRMAGNAVEVDESVATLQGKGPADLVELCFALTAELLVSTGIEKTVDRRQETIAGIDRFRRRAGKIPRNGRRPRRQPRRQAADRPGIRSHRGESRLHCRR